MHQTLRMLIVEDSNDDVDMLLHAMRRGGIAGVTHQIVETLPAMRAALEGQDWDLITSDHSMPQFSASAAIALAKELRPEIPFIIVCGEIDSNLAVSLMKEGAWDYVQKNEFARLVPAIERTLREVQVRHDHAATKGALEVSESRYRRLFETTQDGILILDSETGQILDVNPFLMEMLGYSKEQFLGRKLWEVGAFKDIEASKAAFSELQRASYIRYENLPLEASDGRAIAAEFVSNVYLVDNKKVIQCNIRDVTVRQQAETELHDRNAVSEQRAQQRTGQLEGLVEELKTFNYSVSHDLRAPLRHIDGFADQLQEDYAGRLDAEGVRLLEKIRASVQSMNSLIEALLQLARISRQAVSMRLTDLSSLTRQIADDLRSATPSRKVEFDIAEGITATGDPALLRIVLENLLANAWKFTGLRAFARIEFGTAMQDDGQTAYFVRDNGAGFDMAQATRMFGAFQRLHSESEFPGSGIGLATVQRVVDRHEGRVWAEGSINEGATVYFQV